MQSLFKEKTRQLLDRADVRLDGDRPWDMRVSDDELYRRLFLKGPLGLGEAYMDGWWQSDRLDEFFFRVIRCLEGREPLGPLERAGDLWRRLVNAQRKSRAKKVGENHYDLGNDLFQIMLDKRMVYTCAYWEGAETLDEAQENKLELVCRKMELRPSMRVLDIGCGWGSFAKYAAEKYGAHVTGVTISEEQVKLGRELCAGLPVELLLRDYRDVRGTYDRVVSLGMFEHVGYKNYRRFFEVVDRVLADDGLLLLHSIGTHHRGRAYNAWIDKYIFPNSAIPSMTRVARAAEDLFVMEDWHNFGPYYDKTLMAWFKNFDAGWEKLKSRYDERFYRMWKYFLLASAAAFRSRSLQLWQIVFSKGRLGGYFSVR